MHGPAERIRLEGRAMMELLAFGEPLMLKRPWSLSSAMPHHEGGVLLVVTNPLSRVTLGLQVRPRSDSAPAWLRSPHLDVISHLPEDMEEAQGLAVLRPLAERLLALDGPDTTLDVPESQGDLAPEVDTLDLPPAFRTNALSPFAFGRVYVLDLASDCGQRCTFCSTRAKFSPMTTAKSGDIERMMEGMARGLEAGYNVLRLSGLDPLTHPEVFTLIAHAVALGFEAVHIYSPFTTMAAPERRASLREALGETPVTLHVPVYGAESAIHDAVTGVPGSFAAVSEALSGFKAEGLAASLNLLTVITRDTLAHLEALAAWLGSWGAPIQVFLPFPTTRADDDAFFQVAVAHDALVSRLSACDPPLGLSELLPCVRFRHQIKSGEPALSQGGFHPMSALLGTLFEHADYRRVTDTGANTFTIPVRRCPHAATCALSRVCPKAVYEVYARTFGLSEMQAVSPGELSAHLPELARFIRPA